MDLQFIIDYFWGNLVKKKKKKKETLGLTRTRPQLIWVEFGRTHTRGSLRLSLKNLIILFFTFNLTFSLTNKSLLLISNKKYLYIFHS